MSSLKNYLLIAIFLISAASAHSIDLPESSAISYKSLARRNVIHFKRQAIVATEEKTPPPPPTTNAKLNPPNPSLPITPTSPDPKAKFNSFMGIDMSPQAKIDRSNNKIEWLKKAIDREQDKINKLNPKLAESPNKKADEKSIDGKAAGGKPAEDKTTDGKPAGGKPDDGKPAGGKPDEGKPVGGKPDEGKTAGGKPDEGKPADGKPAEDKPADGTAADEKPADLKSNE